MLSIIISSYQPEYFSALEKNIAETIGIPYEIIKIDNPGLMGICEAYNKGADKSKYDYLLFLHEDVHFHTANWGEKLIKHLKNPETGIIGVAGSDYVPVAPSGWYVNSMKNQFLNLIQNNKERNKPSYQNFTTKPKHQVYALDGVFLGVTKNTFEKLKFDENLIGFHGYDLDFSLRSAKTKKNYFISDILLEHFSFGDMNKEWLDTNITVRKKLGSNFQNNTEAEIEKNMFLAFLDKYLFINGFTIENILKTLKFLPIKKLPLRMTMEILKKIFYYIKFRHDYKQKYSQS